MKKLIAAGLSAVMTFSGIAASADGFFEYENVVSINYNGEYMVYDGIQPKNVDGRIMIPFRAALEGMGATVDYTYSSRLVTAKKGDTTISFTLFDDKIYIDDNGEKSEITMDVPMIIEDGNTLVPIRFLSSAFGMEVGWEKDWFGGGTVLVLDREQLISDFKEAAPNFTKLMELGVPEYNSEQAEFSINFAGTEENRNGGPETVFSFIADAVMDMIVGERATELKANVDFSLLTEDIAVNVEDADLDVIISDGNLYINTDILYKIAKNAPLNDFRRWAMTFTPGDWFSIDLDSLFDKLSFPEELKEMYMNALQNPESYKLSIEDLISMMLPADGELHLYSLLSITSMLETYAMVDKYITIVETSDGGYSASIVIDNDAIVDMIRRLTEEDGDEEMTDEIIAEIKDMFDVDINAISQFDSNKLSSDGNIMFSIRFWDAEMTFDMHLSETAENLDELTEPEIPESSVDLLTLFDMPEWI